MNSLARLQSNTDWRCFLTMIHFPEWRSVTRWETRTSRYQTVSLQIDFGAISVHLANHFRSMFLWSVEGVGGMSERSPKTTARGPPRGRRLPNTGRQSAALLVRASNCGREHWTYPAWTLRHGAVSVECLWWLRVSKITCLLVCHIKGH